MKKFLKLLCLAAILCVGYLALTQPRDGRTPAIREIESGAGEIAGQVKGMYEEYGSAAMAQADEALGDAVAQADETLGDMVEQADQAIEEAVDSAVEGAKNGFFRSMRESVSGFFQGLFAEEEQE